jgi:Zn ribbon nucleic-acid-binding protein
MRCPVCFSREIDVVMLRENDEDHYCVKCGFRGTRAETLGMYRDIQKKYHWMRRRLTVEDQKAL